MYMVSIRRTVNLYSLHLLRTTPHDEHIPVPIFKGLLEEGDYESSTGSPSSDEYEISDEEFDSPCTEP